MSKYVVSAGAETALNEIWQYIARDNFDVADRWIGKLREAIEFIAHTPGMGHTREDLTDLPILFWPVAAYLIIYRVLSDRIEIVAVTQGARDVPSFLRERTQT